jgi:hypothetical protein
MEWGAANDVSPRDPGFAEIYFSIVQRKALTPNDFATLPEPARHLMDFGQHYHTIARPFECCIAVKEEFGVSGPSVVVVGASRSWNSGIFSLAE